MKMSTAIKTFSIILLLGAAIGLAVVYQPSSEQAISVSMTASPQGAKHEDKIILKAALNGNGLSHGEVKLDFASTDPTHMVASSDFRHSISGYTDGQGVFIANGPQFPPGEYMITASVSKAGCSAGRSVCFLRVLPPRQDRRLADGPISITLSNRLGR